ncbi:MFS transporter [Vibrio viridaestus]|uniref:MFS transporter n=1 Tax=Vibrio viridaestus TaxID=2487322 RepID=A0A3N9TKA1_9VIBR|nr:MFS transporter [Vibrio viridaestus]RQW64670.1 MFS transporter [Vibrio viridaestus]
MRATSPFTGLILLSVACLTIMVGCVIVPGLPLIAQNLGVENASSWLVTLPALGVVVFGPLAAKFIDNLGLYKGLCGGLFAYGGLGVIGAFITNIPLLFVDRLLLGGATALVMTSGTGLISELYNGSQRMKMIALQGMSIELGGVIFLFVGGILATLHWSLPFGLYLFAWLLLIAVKACIKAPHTPTRSQHKKLPYEASATVRLTWFAALCSLMVFFMAIISLPDRLATMRLNESQTGLFLAYISLVAVAAAWFMPKAIHLFGERKVLPIAFFLYAIGHTLFFFATNTNLMLVGGFFIGFGFGWSVPLVNHIIVDISLPEFRARNLARLSMAIFSGQFLSSFLTYIPVGKNALFAITAAFSIAISFIVFIGFTKFSKKQSVSQTSNS